MNTKNITIGVLVGAVAVFAVMALKNPAVVSVPTSLKFDASTFGSKAPVVNVPAPVVNVTVPEQKLGGQPILTTDYQCVGGICTYYKKSTSLTAASTTICALQSPAATSSLVYGAVTFSVSSTSASTITLAKAATKFSTTTVLGEKALAASEKGTVLATTTPSAGMNTLVFSPNTYFVVGMNNGTPTGNAPVGACSAVFVSTL